MRLVETVDSTGVRLTNSAMAEIETQIHRLLHLKKWFVENFPKSTSIAIGSFVCELLLEALTLEAKCQNKSVNKLTEERQRAEGKRFKYVPFG